MNSQDAEVLLTSARFEVREGIQFRVILCRMVRSGLSVAVEVFQGQRSQFAYSRIGLEDAQAAKVFADQLTPRQVAVTRALLLKEVLE